MFISILHYFHSAGEVGIKLTETEKNTHIPVSILYTEYCTALL